MTMSKGNDQIERVAAVRRNLRIEDSPELERVLFAYRQNRTETKRPGTERPQISKRLAAQRSFAGVHVSSFASLVLAWGAARLLQFTLKHLLAGNLSKRRARRRLKIVRMLNRASFAILQHH